MPAPAGVTAHDPRSEGGLPRLTPRLTPRLSRPAALAMLALPVALLAACTSGGGTAQPTVTVTQSGTSSASPSGSPSGSARPGIVAVTTAGALVRLDPNTGGVAATLVPSGVVGGEVAVTPDGSTVYFATGGCSPQIERIPVTGGTPAVVTSGSLPSVSPDGTKLAFAREQLAVNFNCVPDMSSKVIVRDISSGTEVTFPLPPDAISNGLPLPISYLSWAPDNKRLAVSLNSVQDNEGWAVNIMDTTAAQYYVPGAGVTNVPPTGSPTPKISYLRQGIFLPDGNLFVTRACCGGFPVHNTSQLLWVVNTSGQMVRQVAVGYPSRQHLSLSADPAGQWLLYLSGTDLYVSANGATPSKLASGLVAAAWS